MMRRRFNTGVAVSAGVHALVLAWTAVSFAARPLESTPVESMPVDIISASEFTQMTAGSKTAAQKPVPKPLVEKQGEAKPVENQSAPVSEKPEIVTASASAAEPPPPPPPPPKVREVKPAPAPEPAKTEPAKPEVKKEPAKVEPDAEALKKAEKKEVKKPEPKKVEPKVVAKPEPKPEPKKPELKKPEQKTEPSFEANKIQALLNKRRPKTPAEKPAESPADEKSAFAADKIQALLDKRQARRVAAVGQTMNDAPDRGAPRGTSAVLSQNEIDALRARITQCWNVPVGAADAQNTAVLLRIRFNKDGSLLTQPTVISRSGGPSFQAMAESAVRAVTRCAPYSFMPVAKYETWKDVEINFDPRDLFRG